MAWKIWLDHVAMATREPEKLRIVLDVLGLKYSGYEDMASQGVKTSFYKCTEVEPPSVELLEPTDPNGTVERYLEKNGAGIHHVSFQVDNLDEVCEALAKNKVKLVYPKPKFGAHNTRVNFVHPKATGGILIEISEKSS